MLRFRTCRPFHQRTPPRSLSISLPPLVLSTLLHLGPSVDTAAAGAWFTEITEETGLDFVHDSGAKGGLEMPESVSPGCAFLDYDEDGDLDLYFTNGSLEFSDPGAADGPQAPTNRLYRQDPGPRFVETTAGSGLDDRSYGMGIAVGDYDGDGRADVYVTNLGRDRLFRNRGDGTFEDVTEAAGIDVPGWSCSASFVDYDHDGDLDIFVARYVDYSPELRCTDPTGRPEYCGPLEFPPMIDVLLRNDGDGTFTDISESSGIADVAGAGLGVVCEDFDEDGRVDIYVANDAYANHLWMYQGDDTFLDDALLLGVAYNIQGMAEAGMGVLAADLDNDLDFDLFMTHLRNESNTLYVNEGPEIGFEDRTAGWGLGSPSMPTTGFGTVALDVELDGDLDLYVGNGSVNRGDPWPGVEVPTPWDRYAEPNHLYLNDGDARFTLAVEEAGTMGSRIEWTRGVAVGDVDADGDLDVLLVNGHGPARLYRNDAPRAGRWLIVRAIKAPPGGDALGAIVTVTAGGRRIMRTVRAAFSYLSSSDPRAHFGLGQVESVDEILVAWPDGTRERFPGGPPDRVVEVVHGQGTVVP
jgi:hypothetical protein